MKSVADDLRREQARRIAALTPGERLQLAFELGDEDVALLSAAHGISTDEARRRIIRSRQAGRTPSRCAVR
jgi:hypothetical protein